MKDKKIEEQYINWAATYDEDKVKLFEKSGIDYNEFMNSFIKVCELKPRMKILDVGAGTGLTSISLAKTLSGNCSILTLEPVDEMIEKAKINISMEDLENIISIKKGTGENIPNKNQIYDLITCTFAIRHMEIENALSEFKRVLKNDGKIVIAEICAPEKWRTLFGKIMAFFMQRIISRKYKGETKSKVITVQEWIELLEKLELSIDKVIEFPGRRDPQWELKRVLISIKK